MSWEGHIPSFDGNKIKMRIDRPKNPKACLLMVHGLTEHIGLYNHPAEYFVEKGYAVYRYDLRGHGETEGKKGWLNDYKDLRDDIHFVVKKMREDFPHSKYFVFGHSLGGFSTILFANEYPGMVNGILLSGALSRGYIPNLEQQVQNNLPKDSLISILHESQMKLFTYHEKLQDYRLALLLDPEESYSFEEAGAGSINSFVKKRNEKDPLILKRLYMKFFHEVVKGLEDLGSHPEGIKDSILMMHGESDRIVDYKDSMILYRSTQIHDKELWIIPKFQHEIINETKGRKVLDKMDDWMVKRL